MSDSDNAQQEPTMEEILASIRRIISEDGDEDAGVDEVVEAEAAPEDDVFDLTDVAEDEPVEDFEDDLMMVDAEPEPEPEPEPEAVFVEPDPEPEPESEPVFEPEPEPEPVIAAQPEPVSEIDPGLLGDKAAGVAMAAFGSLAKTTTLGTATTIEDVVVASLRPLLKDWLDENLPIIVEELVQREIERVSGRGGAS